MKISFPNHACSLTETVTPFGQEIVNPANKKKTELIGWIGFVLFICGLLAIAIPGIVNPVDVLFGLLLSGAGGAIILIYLVRKFKQRYRQ